jgi:hypothetical protein
VLTGRYLAGGGDAAAFARVANPVAKACAAVVMGLVGLLVVIGQPLVSLLASPVYAQAAWMMPVCVAGMLPACWRTLMVIASNTAGRNDRLVVHTAWAAAVAVAVIALTAFGVGPLPLLLAEGIFSWVAFEMARRESALFRAMLQIRVKDLLLMSLAAALAAAFVAAVVHGWMHNTRWALLVHVASQTMVFVLIYSALIFALKIYQTHEVTRLIDFIKNRRNK